MARTVKQRVSDLLQSTRQRGNYLALLACIAVIVAAAAVATLMQGGIAMTHEETVLDCRYNGDGAHTHNADCYDKNGTLVCPLQERELHVHTDDCYTEEGRLACGYEEVTEEHVHGQGCFKTIIVRDGEDAVSEELGENLSDVAASEDILFDGEVTGEHDTALVRVHVRAPEGSFPEGTTMRIKLLDCADVDEAVTDVVAKESTATVAQIQPVDIAFFDKDGKEVEPARPIEVTMASDLIAQGENPLVVHVDDEGKADVVSTMSDEELRARKESVKDDELRFNSNHFSTYCIVLTTMQQTLTASDGRSYSITVECPAEANIPQGATLEVTELPQASRAYQSCLNQVDEALPTNMEIGFARLFDISIVSNGQKVQPDVPVSVKIELTDDEAIAAGTQLQVMHSPDDTNEIEDIDAQVRDTASESIVSFEANGFSVYAIVATTLKKNVLASDGRNYRVSVTYGTDARVPADAELQVREITRESEREGYLSQVGDFLGWDGSATYARVFDITIVDAQGEKVTIAAPVEVSIELADKDTSAAAAADTQVLHFADGADVPDLVSGVDVSGDTVSFEANGFSAYAIVQGPDAIPLGWYKISSLEELTARGYYIGTTGGYYMTNATAIGKQDANTTGIVKTTPAQSYPVDGAALYYFEPVDGHANQFYAYCIGADGTRQYVRNTGDANLYLVGEADRTAFTATVDASGRFRFYNGNRYWNMWNGANGNHIACWTSANDANNYFYVWGDTDYEGDPYGLDGKTYGLMNWDNGPIGKAMMAEQATSRALTALPLTVLAKSSDNTDKLFVPNDSDISLWKFEWSGTGDAYRLSTTVDGSTRYLTIGSNGLGLTSDQASASQIKVMPGTGVHAGQLCLKVNNVTLTYSGTTANGFSTNGAAGNEWLNLVEVSELTADYFMTYSAAKVSISDESVTTGSKIIVYTRAWNETTKKYEFYAVDHDGSLVRCYESGDDIQWVGNRINSLLWQFTEYMDGDSPSYYYELYNEYSQKYLAPQVTGGQILSDNTIGINLDGRRNGKYYSTILAWDDPNYAYAGLKVENGKIVTCPKSEAMDFYFAVMQDIEVDDTLHTVSTVDNAQYGITMKIVDFNGKANKHDGTTTTDEQHNVLGDSTYRNGNQTSGLLSTNLDANGYPTATKSGSSLASLYAGAYEVNHLFIDSTYRSSGYFEYDSTQNYAYLDGRNFTVYQEIGTMDSSGTGKFYTHGQFMPFNAIEAGVFAASNKENLTSATGANLPNSDPRKHERLYLVKNPDYYVGVELEASFVQTPNGLDDWGHDIIYEFTGDDDFWLYVDGELVIDLGGIHDALAGNVNFRTGEVVVNGTRTTLYQLFYDNYVGRGHTAEQAQAYVDDLFERNDDGQWIFKANTSHTMRIFYMERGAGASNLHMRFNLASIKPGTVLLSKQLGGVDTTESVLAEFPYQILYKLEGSDEEHYLTNQVANDPDLMTDYVLYKGTTTPVKYQHDGFVIDGVAYNDVFFLKPNETAEIAFPEGTASYRIVECGVNTKVYSKVTVNGTEVEGTPRGEGRADYGIGYAGMGERARVAYRNKVNKDALRTLTIAKRLFDETGNNEIDAEHDPTTFSFRLYLGTEFDAQPALANMHTYHVIDVAGNYCRWDADEHRFASLGESDYDALSDADKDAATFHTSLNGSISKIPVGYTVEVREVLAGTQFMVEERGYEIPDGYSLQRYELFDDAGDEQPSYSSSEAPAQGTVVARKDPHVDVRNLKGWGLRMNKVWSDADYMSERDATYFAVFTRPTAESDEAELELVPGTLRQLAYGKKTLYWYFLPLPVDVPFNQYEILEVTLEGAEPVVDDEAYVTNEQSLTVAPLAHKDSFELNGKQKGEETSSAFKYTVLYDRGKVDGGSNVRVDTTTNNRPGIVLRKTDWNGEPLAGATFTLTDADGTLIGTFTSDDTGLITVAFLRDGVAYTLEETKAPQRYCGLLAPLTLTLDSGTVSVAYPDEQYFELKQDEGGTPTLTIKNRPYTLGALKVDGDSGEPLAGANFALYRQVSVNGVTSFDVNPMPGYEQLTSGDDGLIPQVNETLPAGTYELRELAPVSGYQPLGGHIGFTIAPTGAVTLGAHPDGVELAADPAQDGSIPYVITIPNVQRRRIRIKKVDIADIDNSALEGATFDLYRVVDGAAEAEALYKDMVSGTDGMLAKDGRTELTLANGVYHLVETKAPEGYLPMVDPVVITVDASGVTYDDGTSQSVDGRGLSVDPVDGVYTLKVTNTAGYELPHTGGPGTWGITLTGLTLVFSAMGLLLRKRALA